MLFTRTIVFNRVMNCSSKDPIFVCHYQLQCSCKSCRKNWKLYKGETFSPYSMHDKLNQNVPFFFSSQAARNGTKMTSNKSWSVTSIRAWTKKMESYLMASPTISTLLYTSICRLHTHLDIQVIVYQRFWQVFLSELYRNTLKLFRLYRHTDKTVQLATTRCLTGTWT